MNDNFDLSLNKTEIEVNLGVPEIEIELPGGARGLKGDTGATGPQGETGPANTLTMGTVQSGDTASAEITGDAPNQTLNLTLPKGDTGEQGPGITSIEKTSTSGLVDTYTITYGDSDTATFNVTNGADGQDGNDGVSPTATVTQTDSGATISITDASGTTTANIANGSKGDTGSTGPQGPSGQDGVSPTITSSKSGKTTTLTITDAGGTSTAEIVDGNDGTNGVDGEDGVSPIITTSKSGKTTTITIVDAEGTKTATILDGADGQGSGDMLTSVYDTNHSGIVDNAESVNGHTVGIDVPANAVFTDTTYTAGTGIDITNGVISNTQTSAEWGNITGTLSNQTDLQDSLDEKVNSYDENSYTNEYSNIAKTGSGIAMSANDTNYKLTANSTIDTSGVSSYYKVNGSKTGEIKINSNGTSITGVVTPTTNDMAANKVYVDSSVSGLISVESDPIFTSSASYGISSSDITAWNGKYTKPSGGIPSTDMTSAVQTSLGKADTALQSISSSDVTTALGYTPYNSSNPNGYTSNTGTITSVKMNGSTVSSSGEADLGTVITSHQDISGKQDKLVSGTNIKTVNNYSLLGSGDLSVGDALPIGTEVDYNGSTVPNGWEQIDGHHIITAILESNYTITATGSYETVPLKQKHKYGSKLTTRSDGGIEIGSGVNVVKVSSNISYNSVASANAKWNTIYQNTSALYPAPTYASNRVSIGNTGGLIPVVQGDIIYLKCQGTQGDVIRGGTSNYYTCLTVEVVE